jgi:protein TonB
MPYRIFGLLICGLIVASMAQSGPKPKDVPSCEVSVNPGARIIPPRVISSADPIYPGLGSADHHPKVVLLAVVVGSDGRACGPQVVRSPGPDFERAALSAIRDWRWKPATRDGKPVAVSISVEMEFQSTK